MQFVPEDGVYVYFRYDEKQTIMVVMNTAKEERKIKINRYNERTGAFKNYTDVVTKTKGALTDFNLGSYKTVVYELNP